MKYIEWQLYREYIIQNLYGGRCVRCGTKSGLFLHHIKRKSEGGIDRVDNLLAVCRKCHFKIEDMSGWDRSKVIQPPELLARRQNQ
jgi:5-methylcytosine-specific restriction endonuclease McrA